jgi:hypothetical protein
MVGSWIRRLIGRTPELHRYMGGPRIQYIDMYRHSHTREQYQEFLGRLDAVYPSQEDR